MICDNIVKKNLYTPHIFFSLKNPNSEFTSLTFYCCHGDGATKYRGVENLVH